jgi:hypothetical protein
MNVIPSLCLLCNCHVVLLMKTDKVQRVHAQVTAKKPLPVSLPLTLTQLPHRGSRTFSPNICAATEAVCHIQSRHDILVLARQVQVNAHACVGLRVELCVCVCACMCADVFVCASEHSEKVDFCFGRICLGLSRLIFSINIAYSAQILIPIRLQCNAHASIHKRTWTRDNILMPISLVSAQASSSRYTG